MRIWARRLLCLEPMVISEEEHEQMPERTGAIESAEGCAGLGNRGRSMNADYTVTTKRLPNQAKPSMVVP